jgi:hypothetical protein
LIDWYVIIYILNLGRRFFFLLLNNYKFFRIQGSLLMRKLHPYMNNVTRRRWKVFYKIFKAICKLRRTGIFESSIHLLSYRLIYILRSSTSSCMTPALSISSNTIFTLIIKKLKILHNKVFLEPNYGIYNSNKFFISYKIRQIVNWIHRIMQYPFMSSHITLWNISEKSHEFSRHYSIRPALYKYDLTRSPTLLNQLTSFK